MKKILFFLTVLVSFNLFAQTTPTGQPTGFFPFTKPQNNRGNQVNGLQVQSELYIAYRDTDFVAARPGALVKRPADSTNSIVYASYKSGWIAISGVASYPTLQQVTDRDSTINSEVQFTLLRANSGLHFKPTLPLTVETKALRFSGHTSGGTTMPYLLSAYFNQQGAFHSGVQAVFSNKRVDIGGDIQGVQGFTNEPSYVSVSTDINGPALALEASGSNTNGNNESALAIYDREDIWSGATSYSLGYGRKKFAMSGIGGMYWGTNLGNNFRSNALSSLKVTGSTFRLNDNLDIGVDGSNASLGVVNVSGNLFLDAAIIGANGFELHKASKQFVFPGSSSGAITMSAVTGTYHFRLPPTAGTDGQVLKTDGNGVTEWVDQSGGSGDNFANTDLSFTGNRVHNAKGYSLTLDSLEYLNILVQDAAIDDSAASSIGLYKDNLAISASRWDDDTAFAAHFQASFDGLKTPVVQLAATGGGGAAVNYFRLWKDSARFEHYTAGAGDIKVLTVPINSTAGQTRDTIATKADVRAGSATPTLYEILANSNNAGGESITNVDNLDVNTINVGSTITATNEITASNILSTNATDIAANTTNIASNTSAIAGKQSTLTNSAGLAAALSDETGTGLAVFGTSPTITTSILTGSSTFALLNATPTTINAFGAATTLNIGAASATWNIGDNTTINGTAANADVTIQGTSSGTRATSYVNLQPNGGFVGIGTSTPGATFGDLLHVRKDQASRTDILVENQTAGGYAAIDLRTNAGLVEFGKGGSTMAAGFGLPNGSGFFYNDGGATGLGFINGSTGDIFFNAGNSSTPHITIKGTGSVGIGTTSPNAAALLDVSSTTKGVLMPRMTGAQASAISSPPDGLIVYITATDATFTSIDFWGRVNGAWKAL